MRDIVRTVAACAIVVVIGLGLALIAERAPRVDAAARDVVLHVHAHPDDEWQTWSVVDSAPDAFHLFAILTRGEESGFCDAETGELGLQLGLEPAPTPAPEGRWTASCEDARIASLEGYLRQMYVRDDGSPEVLMAGEDAELQAEGIELCRYDGNETCVDATRIQQFHDVDGRFGAIVFDLGDGDLTQAEAAAAVTAIVTDAVPGALPRDSRMAGITGNFSSPANGHRGCFAYPHPDHLAIDAALWHNDFGAGFQIGAVCAGDPRRQLSLSASGASTERAFSLQESEEGLVRTGAHTANYGWLNTSYYPVDRLGQTELFHQRQHFWVRHW